MAEYFIGLVLNPAHSRQVDKFRKLFYADSSKRHPPHITVIEPFRWSEISPRIQSEQDLVSVINEAASNNLSKLANLKVESISPMSEKTIIKLNPNPDLTNLRQKLLSEIGLPEKHYPYTPHITLGKLDAAGKSEAERRFVELDNEISPTGLQLFRKHPKDGNYVWQALRFIF